MGDLNITHQRIDVHEKQPEITGNTREEKDSFNKLLKENSMIDTFRFFKVLKGVKKCGFLFSTKKINSS